jgi:hypothetical protein
VSRAFGKLEAEILSALVPVGVAYFAGTSRHAAAGSSLSRTKSLADQLRITWGLRLESNSTGDHLQVVAALGPSGKSGEVTGADRCMLRKRPSVAFSRG